MSYKAVSATTSNQRVNVEGKKRGDNNKFDYYYFTGMSVIYSLASPKKMEYNTSYRNFFNF
jgi:hypothetical protein